MMREIQQQVQRSRRTKKGGNGINRLIRAGTKCDLCCWHQLEPEGRTLELVKNWYLLLILSRDVPKEEIP